MDKRLTDRNTYIIEEERICLYLRGKSTGRRGWSCSAGSCRPFAAYTHST